MGVTETKGLLLLRLFAAALAGRALALGYAELKGLFAGSWEGSPCNGAIEPGRRLPAVFSCFWAWLTLGVRSHGTMILQTFESTYLIVSGQCQGVPDRLTHFWHAGRDTFSTATIQ